MLTGPFTPSLMYDDDHARHALSAALQAVLGCPQNTVWVSGWRPDQHHDVVLRSIRDFLVHKVRYRESRNACMHSAEASIHRPALALPGLGSAFRLAGRLEESKLTAASLGTEPAMPLAGRPLKHAAGTLHACMLMRAADHERA